MPKSDYDLDKRPVEPEQIMETLRSWVDNIVLDPGEGYTGECRMFKAGFGQFPCVCRGNCGPKKKCAFNMSYDGHRKRLRGWCACE